jgi:hypothetical protein
VAGINAVRAGLGLRALELHPELERKAGDWAAYLAAVGVLEHSTLDDGITADWLSLAENLAAAVTLDGAEHEVLTSPGVTAQSGVWPLAGLVAVWTSRMVQWGRRRRTPTVRS